jgi:hypothetical protein
MEQKDNEIIHTHTHTIKTSLAGSSQYTLYRGLDHYF